MHNWDTGDQSEEQGRSEDSMAESTGLGVKLLRHSGPPSAVCLAHLARAQLSHTLLHRSNEERSVNQKRLTHRSC